MSLNIDIVLNNIWGNYSANKKKNTNANNSSGVPNNIDSNIFAQASALVAEYKEDNSQSKKSDKAEKVSYGGLSFMQVANMSTKDFLSYAYNNEAFSVDKQDSSGIDLPMIVSYKGRVVSTAGKSFMAVVAKFKAMYPHRSEEEIAAELMSKYGTGTTDKEDSSNKSDSSNKKTTGKTVNISA